MVVFLNKSNKILVKLNVSERKTSLFFTDYNFEIES